MYYNNYFKILQIPITVLMVFILRYCYIPILSSLSIFPLYEVYFTSKSCRINSIPWLAWSDQSADVDVKPSEDAETIYKITIRQISICKTKLTLNGLKAPAYYCIIKGDSVRVRIHFTLLQSFVFLMYSNFNVSLFYNLSWHRLWVRYL